MESRAKLFGHPIHPMLIPFPLGLLLTSVAFDVVHLLTDNGKWAEVAHWMIAAGIVGGIVAAPPGWIDWFAIPPGTRAKAVGLWHGVGNLVVLGLFAVALRMRWGDPEHLPTLVPAILEAVAIVLALVTGWLGGELVERLGVGVDPGAHLDAPNSLSGRPARGG